jgi:transposase
LSHELKNSLAIKVIEALDRAEAPPQNESESVHQPRWTLKRFVTWLEEKFQLSCCRETVRKALKSRGFSWKKARKILNKANTQKRELFVEKLAMLLSDATAGERTLIYIDEAHIHLDTDEGYGWSLLGKRFWVSSCSPGRAKVSFFGVYIYNQGKVNIYPYERGNSETTIDVLEKIRADLPDENITIIWDGARYHRSNLVKKAAKRLNIELQLLPAYSPDFMPVEHLWAWLREDVTYHTCYKTKEQLINQVEHFQQRINENPTRIADRLWTKTKLDLDEEKLRFSS